MNTNNLDGIDFLQIISIVAALLIGFLPNLKSLKNNNNKFNNFGIAMFILFGISLITAFFSTAAKSSADKEGYSNLFESTNAALTASNQNIEKSKAILLLQSRSIDSLASIQQKELALHDQGLLLANKSDAIQLKSELLNKKLLEQIILQKRITNSANKILVNLESQKASLEQFNKFRLMSSIKNLNLSKFVLFNGLNNVKVDFENTFKKIKKEHELLSDSINNIIKSIGLPI